MMIRSGLLALSICVAAALPGAAEERPAAKGKVLLIGKQPDHPFIDAEGYRACVDLKEKAFRTMLAEQRGAKEKTE